MGAAASPAENTSCPTLGDGKSTMPFVSNEPSDGKPRRNSRKVAKMGGPGFQSAFLAVNRLRTMSVPWNGARFVSSVGAPTTVLGAGEKGKARCQPKHSRPMCGVDCPVRSLGRGFTLALGAITAPPAVGWLVSGRTWEQGQIVRGLGGGEGKK